MPRKKQGAQAKALPPPPAVKPQSQSAEDGKTGFLDLSPEIRNEIYHLALIFRGAIRLYTRHTKDGRGRFYATILFNDVGQPTNQISLEGVKILATCRQINEEATPILYGANTFVVDWEDCLNPFTVNTLPLVRNLMVTSRLLARLKPVGALFVKLRKCILQQRSSLVNLKLEHSICGEMTACYLAQRLTPTMRAMIKGGKSIDEAINMVEFYSEYRGSDSHQSYLGIRAAAHTSQVKEELGKILRK